MHDRTMKKGLAVVAIMLNLFALGCNEAGRDDAPVFLVASVDQEVFTYDLLNPPTGGIATITFSAIAKRGDLTAAQLNLLDVILRSYRITFRRTDGGTLVPETIVRNITQVIPINSTAQLGGGFQVFEPSMFSEAPFVALYPTSGTGGVDPETGRREVRMEIVADFFGETLSGENVSTRAVVPITFCAGCTS